MAVLKEQAMLKMIVYSRSSMSVDTLSLPLTEFKSQRLESESMEETLLRLIGQIRGEPGVSLYMEADV